MKPEEIKSFLTANRDLLSELYVNEDGHGDEMELGETLLVTEKEVHLLVQHLQEKHPERSVLEYLNSRYGE